jgi:Fanconi-associated nuclease 1
MAKDYASHRGGVPDLCLWKYESLEFMLVEVKGQGDRLSDKQQVGSNIKIDLGLVRDFGGYRNQGSSRSYLFKINKNTIYFI